MAEDFSSHIIAKVVFRFQAQQSLTLLILLLRPRELHMLLLSDWDASHQVLVCLILITTFESTFVSRKPSLLHIELLYQKGSQV